MSRIPILVTGGAGYIGAHTCKALASSGYLPVTFDNLTTGHRQFVQWGPLIEADIRDEVLVAAVSREYKVLAAIHFAADALVGESMGDPLKYYTNNVAGTVSLLNGLRSARVDKIVFSSTCAVYGNPNAQLIDESTFPRPINPYGASKLMVERILADCEIAHGVRWAALRYFNACGADLDGGIGELRENETHLIPRAILWALGQLEDFRVFGTDYPTPDGTAVRDYIHVCDLARAHVLCLNQVLKGQQIGGMNVGTGIGYSVREVIAEISRHAKRPLPPVASGRRPGDPPRLIADPRLAQQRLGFRPELSDLPTIIRSAWAWHARNCTIRR